MYNNTENYIEVFLKAFLTYGEFRQLFVDNWKGEFFDSSEDKYFYYILKSAWKQEHKLLTKHDVLLEVGSKSKYDKSREKIVERVEQVYTLNMAEYTESFVRDQFLDILKRRKLQSAVKKIIEEVNKTGKVDEPSIKNEIIKSLEVTDGLRDMGIDYFDTDILARMKILQEMQVSHFKTGFNVDLDDVLRLKRGTVVAVSAQLGVGKSLFLNNLAVSMAQEGANVLYLSLEMEAFDISKRLDRIALGFHEDEYFKAADLVVQRMSEQKKEYPKCGKLFIRSYSPRSLTCMQIRSILENYKMKNIGIDVILVDYLTLMRPNSIRKDDSMYMRGKDIAEELQAVAKDNRCLIFTALQVKNEAYGKNKQGSELVAESLAIPQILDTLINMVEVIIDEGDQKFFVINFEKTRDSKKTNKRIYLKLKDNLRIVDTTQGERDKLEEIVTKKKSTVQKQQTKQDVEMDLEVL